MTDARQRVEQDRAMRNTAKGLVANGMKNLRGDLEEQGIGARAAVRFREGAEGLGEDVSDFVRENPSRVGSGLALGAGLLLTWLFRDRLSAIFAPLLAPEPGEDPTPDQPPAEPISNQARSETD